MAPENVWTQMGYVPPRGACNHKDSLLSPKCPCQRFMAHPLKMSTSFECDGCNHHASFHNMENPSDDAVIKRWQEQSVQQQADSSDGAGSRKRPRRAIENGAASSTEDAFTSTRTNPRAKKPARQASTLRNGRGQRRSPAMSDTLERIVDLSDG